MNVYAMTAVEPPLADEGSFPENYVGCYGDKSGARALTLAVTDSDTMTMEVRSVPHEKRGAAPRAWREFTMDDIQTDLCLE